MKRLSNEKGSILVAVLAILTMLALILMSVVSYGVWHRGRSRQLINQVSASYLAEAGINRALALFSQNSSYRSVGTREEIENAGSFTFTVQPWGGYLKITSRGISGSARKVQQALIGIRPPAIFKNAIVLFGPPYPLVVSGMTHINGDVAVGLSGVTSGEIKGRSYQGKELIHGQITVIRSEELPKFDGTLVNAFLDSVTNWKRNCTSVSNLALAIHSQSEIPELPDSFFRTTSAIEVIMTDSSLVKLPRYLFADETVTVGGESKLKDVLISSTKRISILGTANLEECILIAPLISIAENSTISSQVFASDSITVTGSAHVMENSFLCLSGHQRKDAVEGLVILGSSVPIRGCVVFSPSLTKGWNKSSTDRLEARICVSPRCWLLGTVWSEGYAEVLGKVSGSIATNLLYYNDPPTVYHNWLVDARVSCSENEHETILPLVFRPLPNLAYRDIREVTN